MKLTDSLSVPNNWSRKYDKYEIHQEELYHDWEYKKVKNYLEGTPLSNLKKITRAQSPFLYFRYQLRKEEYEVRGIQFREETLLHATDEDNIDSILKDNLDWRRVYRAKYGKGVSFSPSASYANGECSRRNGRDRAIIAAKVLIGNKICGSYYQELPEDGYDTTTGNTNVYVKYYDDEFYPEYICYYRN